MSADTRPISSTRFAAALKDLSIDMLHLKILEIRNSIAHLQYSNDQLKPFAEGTATAASPSSPQNDASSSEPDQDCIDAIRENEQVIDRMAERIALIRIEVEDRGVSWNEFQSKEEVAEASAKDGQGCSQGPPNGDANGHAEAEQNGAEGRHAAWADGTFQTGTIRNGEVCYDSQPGRPEGGGSLSDEQLRQALEERMRNLTHNDENEGGMHL